MVVHLRVGDDIAQVDLKLDRVVCDFTDRDEATAKLESFRDLADKHFLRAKAFYEELLRDGEPLFERDRGTVIYLHPGIRVYAIQ